MKRVTKMNTNKDDFQDTEELLTLCLCDQHDYLLTQCSELDELSDEELAECLHDTSLTHPYRNPN